jgi:hypothetical protein
MTFALSPRHVPSLLSRGALAALMTLAVAACAPMGATPQAATFPEPPAPPQAWNVLVTLQGTVQSMTADAQGVPQTLMVQGQGGASQINVGPEFAPVLARRVAQGDTISATVVAEPPPAVNPLIPPEVVGATPAPTAYRLISLRDARGVVYTPPSAADVRFTHVEGTIAAIQNDANNQPTAVKLDTGDLVYVNPREFKQHALAVGVRFSADGPSVRQPDGSLVMSARQVNGLDLRVSLPQGGWGHRVIEDEGGDEGDYGDMYDGGGEE